MKQAIQEGALDDLPGKGKPLHFEASALHDEHWLVNKILKNANYLPPWLEFDQNIRESKERAPLLIAEHQAWLKEQDARLKAAPTHVQSEIIERIRHVHGRKQQEYTQLIQGINPMIRKMNLEAPLPHFQKNVIDEGAWLSRFSACEEQFSEIIDQWSVQRETGATEPGWFGRFKQLMKRLYSKV